MKTTIFKVPTLAWYGNSNLALPFPSAWQVHFCPMAGHDRRPMNAKEIQFAIKNPVGTKPIAQLAESKKEAAILFDELTRPTRVSEIVPFVLEELRLGGISEEHVRFVAALGTHGTCDRIDFAKKLGNDIVERFPVYNHNAFTNLATLGKTSRGTPVQVNREVMGCDLKIGIGCVVPHPEAGFGGGAKIIIPGVASLDTVRSIHGDLAGGLGVDTDRLHPTVGWGKVERNVLRLDMEEAARMASLDFKIDVIINGRGESTDLFAGDFIAEHREAVKAGKQVYVTKPIEEPDIVVANAFAKANQAVVAAQSTVVKMKKNGTLVIVANAPDGQGTHYLFGKFGKKLGGPLYSPTPSKYKKVIIYSQYKVPDPFLPIVENDDAIYTKEWSEVLEILRTMHPGRPNVALYPNADIQMSPDAIE